MTKVYVVTEGEYSDAAVAGVFSALELAESFKARCCRYAQIDEFAVDAVDTVSGLTPYAVEMDIDGDNAKVSGVRWGSSDDTDVWESCRPLDPNSRIQCRTQMVKTVRTYVRARDETHAIKIANERRAMWLANGGKNKEA